MPAQSSARRNLGIGPLFSGAGIGSTRTDHLRVSDAERQAVVDRLAEHYGEGRLDQAEFDERVGQAMSAKTRADLAGLFDDLPEPGASSGPGAGAEPAGAPGAPERRADLRPRRHHHGHSLLPIALIVLIAIVATHAVHAVFWFTVSWVWLAFLAIIVLAVTGHLGRRNR
jgi:Domain of unknown function (DUF1707)